MKKVLSLIVAILIIASITVSASAAVTMYPYVFKAVHTDGVEYTFHFGTRDNTSEEVGIEINGKKYQATSFDAETNTKFGIGIADPQNILGDEYAYKTFSGSSYSEETTIAKADIPAWDEIAPEEEVDNTVYEQKAFTLQGMYTIDRNDTTLGLNKWTTANLMTANYARLRYYKPSAAPEPISKEMALLQFTTEALGITDTDEIKDKVILTVYATGTAAAQTESTMIVAGIANEDYIHTEGTRDNMVTEDDTYVYTVKIDEQLPIYSSTITPMAFQFDVTDYVKEVLGRKNRLENGQAQVSFLISLVDADYTSGSTYVYINTNKKPEYIPTITYKK